MPRRCGRFLTRPSQEKWGRLLQIKGSYSFDASLEDVWNTLLSPDVLSACIPGCESFEQTGQDTYELSLKAKVAAISGKYSGKVAISERVDLKSYRIAVQGSGTGGTVKGDAVLRFSQDGEETKIDVEGDAQVAGVIARVGQRLLGSVSNMLMNQFFDCVKDRVEGR